ncbi:hypothetical protein GCM10010495_69610 [Kitasatospora herbaricolor]|uniref:hypothetical protein n=1 Tax=Kitasatospora herbaricolor TaxID=68217 RepID=UPI00174AD073|nr:hypothetical protein [Kitasatospora herbaricolor]MDQ0313324.1 hypothetical protein [Kitasatospora herbaricolor]GGV42035.1 hypothetical protein GCM10010495_69610 [Kitasatospora herbaricolor]
MNNGQLPLGGDAQALLAPAQRLTNWRAFIASLAANREAVVKDPDLVHLATHVVEVFAEYAAHSGLTRAQLRQHLGPSGRGWPPAVLDSRLSLMIDMNFLEPYLLKSHQDRYVMRPAGLAGALAAQRLASHGGVDELIALMDRTRELFRHDNPDPALVLRELRTCRHGLVVFALDLQRQVATATPAELVIAQRQHDHTDFTRQVTGLNRLVTRAFPGHPVMEDAATALIEAAQFYRDQQIAAVGKVLDQGGASLNLDVLTAAEYAHLARTAGTERLGHFGACLVADAAPLWIDGQDVVEAAAACIPAATPRARPAPPLPTPGDDNDPLDALDDALAHEDLRQRVLMEDLLGDLTHVQLGDVLEAKGWPAAARLLADLLAADADPLAPYQVDIAVPVRVDAGAKVTYLHDVQLRLGAPQSGNEEEGDE